VGFCAANDGAITETTAIPVHNTTINLSINSTYLLLRGINAEAKKKKKNSTYRFAVTL